MRLIIEENDAKAGLWTARYIVARIKEKAARTDRPFVLGLPTGSTPVETYKELVRLYEAGEVSFRNVVTFNMDEYVGIPEDHPESYHTFMRKHFFDHVDVPAANIHILDGNAPDLQRSARSTSVRSSPQAASTSSWAVSAKTAISPSTNPIRRSCRARA